MDPAADLTQAIIDRLDSEGTRAGRLLDDLAEDFEA